MLPYNDEMWARLAEVDDTQRALIQALAEALRRADQKLLDDVRSVKMDHEARRVEILNELYNLASTIGAFPASQDPLPPLEDAGSGPRTYVAVEGTQEIDWRQAVSNLKGEFRRLPRDMGH